MLTNFTAVDLTEDTLEDLLSYDDQFLDYFNAFLQLPVRWKIDLYAFML